MKIAKKDFYQYIAAYTEEELFYKKMYEEERRNPGSFMDFIQSLDRDYIEHHALYVPAIHGDWVSYMTEKYTFQFGKNNISALKHYRYTPEFVHEHEPYEIFYVYDGQCRNTIQGVTRMCRTGDICIIPPKTKHSIGVFDDSVILNLIIRSSTFHSAFFAIFTGENALSQFFSHILYDKTENNYLLFHTGQDAAIRSLIEDIFIEYLGHQKYAPTILDCKMMLLFCLLLRCHEHHLEEFLNSNRNLNLVRILNYFQDHYLDVTLESAAREFGFSAPHFSKLIKENTGKTFMEIMKGIRLEKACYALTHTDLSIMNICDISGYHTPEHFSRTFKETFGISPGEYRKQYRVID